MKKIFNYLILFCICLFCNRVYAFESYNIGDQVTYNGDSYHVIDYSNEDTEYVTLLKDNYLTTSQIDKYKGDIPLNNRVKTGTLPYYDFNDNYVTNYNETKIKKVVDLWADDKFGNNLVEINGYKARLLDTTDISYLGYTKSQSCANKIVNFHYQIKDSNISWESGYECVDNECYYTFTFDDVKYRSCPGYNFNENGNIGLCDIYNKNDYKYDLFEFVDAVKSVETCEMVSYNDKYLRSDNFYNWINGDKFWTMMPSHIESNNAVYYFNSNEFYYNLGKSNGTLPIRPVINVKKSLFGNRTDYNLGDEITYDGDVYNVLYQTDSNDNYVTLFKKSALLNTDIMSYLGINQDGLFEYYYSDNCNADVDSSCTSNYQESIVKTIINNWYNDNISKVHQIKVNDEYTRLLDIDELMEKFGYIKQGFASDVEVVATEDTPKWLYDSSYNYWISGSFSDSTLRVCAVSKYVSLLDVYDISRIRPVIYLSKCGLGDLECSNLVCPDGTTPVKKKKNVYKEYKSGDIVTLNNEDYIVIYDSLKRNNNLTLLKVKSLTLDDIKKYYDVNSFDNKVPFYTSNNCNSEVTSGTNDCTSDYDSSIVKMIVDKWVNDNFKDDDLNEIDGYKARLITYDELNNYLYLILNDSSDDLISNISTWTMSSIGNKINCFSNGLNEQEVYKKESINPIINVNKCAMENGCYEEEVVIGCLDEDGNIIPFEAKEVEVASTLSTISKIAMLISFFLIISGIILISYTYRHKLLARKINKN